MPGPDDEVQTVRWIYVAFTKEGKREAEIAALLNSRGVSNESGKVASNSLDWRLGYHRGKAGQGQHQRFRSNLTAFDNFSSVM